MCIYLCVCWYVWVYVCVHPSVPLHIIFVLFGCGVTLTLFACLFCPLLGRAEMRAEALQFDSKQEHDTYSLRCLSPRLPCKAWTVLAEDLWGERDARGHRLARDSLA